MTLVNKVEEQLLLILTWKLRVMTDTQITAALGISSCEHRAFTRRLARLQCRGFVRRTRIALALVAIAEPLAAWKPGANAARWERLAWELEKRIATAPRSVVTLTWATRRAANLVGGVGGRLRQPLQVEHDLGIAAVYVRRSTTSCHMTWVGEDAYRRHFLRDRRPKVPDAVLLDSNNRVVKAIEYGGQYSSEKLRDFHRYWSRKRIPYEIW